MSVLVFQTYETVVIRAWPSSKASPPPRGEALAGTCHHSSVRGLALEWERAAQEEEWAPH